MSWRRRASDLVDDTANCRAEFAAAVPSAVDYLDFRLRCTVGWEGEPRIRPFVMRAVAEQARSTLRRYHPTHCQLAEIQVTADLAALTMKQADSEVLVHTWGVAVTVDDEHLDLARQHATRQRALAEQAATDHAELKYLTDTVFADPATAAMWWLRHNEFNLEKVEPTITRLRAVLRTVANSDVPGWVDQFQQLIAVVVGRLEPKLEVGLLQELAALLDKFKASEQAAQLKERAHNLATNRGG